MTTLPYSLITVLKSYEQTMQFQTPAIRINPQYPKRQNQIQVQITKSNRNKEWILLTSRCRRHLSLTTINLRLFSSLILSPANSNAPSIKPSFTQSLYIITMFSNSTLRFLFFFVVFASVLSSSNSSDYVDSECLAVSTSSFISSLTTAISVIREVVPIISGFSSLLGDSRLSHAVSDCLDLLDFSSDELSWSVSATQSPNGK